MNSEYPAVIIVAVPVKIIVQLDHLNREEIIIISPVKLGSGGIAMLARMAKNHHMPIRGRNF